MNFRQTMFKCLVDTLGVPAGKLSRINDDGPVAIELTKGGEIYLSKENDAIYTGVKVPFRNKNSLQLNASKIISILTENKDVVVNVLGENLVIMINVSCESRDLSKDLSEALTTLNNAALALADM
ncbi:hypothetical protein EJ063_07545 [Vibrio aquaticus]|uniref:Uncharacterized protein n=1 Tax=Vibrio aquaticus TaxID=2496559 RepID=A0A432CXL4_9VIBR|nr:hypothetical protein [Vibrio aquaticus]RTZ16640.1 hypothetical protein EJ063_07545 [Vibrio aquaticus]